MLYLIKSLVTNTKHLESFKNSNRKIIECSRTEAERVILWDILPWLRRGHVKCFTSLFTLFKILISYLQCSNSHSMVFLCVAFIQNESMIIISSSLRQVEQNQQLNHFFLCKKTIRSIKLSCTHEINNKIYLNVSDNDLSQWLFVNNRHYN